MQHLCASSIIFPGRSIAASLAIMLAASALGCNRREMAQKNNAATSTRRDSRYCAEHCLRTGVAFARSLLGIDPSDRPGETPPDSKGLIELLKSECEASGARIQLVDLLQIVDHLADGPCRPILLIDPGGHLHFVIGKMTVGHRELFQTLHGDGPIRLLSKPELTDIGGCTTRCFKTTKGFPSGSAVLRCD